METNPNAHWVKIRDLEGKQFTLTKVNEGNVRGKPCFIFEMADGGLFSAAKAGADGKGSTIGAQVAREGTPPTGPAHTYTVVKTATDANPSGYSLALKHL